MDETDRMSEVSRDEFFATVGQMNVHPRAEREASYWETPSRVLKGITKPGYLGGDDKRYFVATPSKEERDDQ